MELSHFLQDKIFNYIWKYNTFDKRYFRVNKSFLISLSLVSWRWFEKISKLISDLSILPSCDDHNFNDTIKHINNRCCIIKYFGEVSYRLPERNKRTLYEYLLKINRISCIPNNQPSIPSQDIEFLLSQGCNQSLRSFYFDHTIQSLSEMTKSLVYFNANLLECIHINFNVTFDDLLANTVVVEMKYIPSLVNLNRYNLVKLSLNISYFAQCAELHLKTLRNLSTDMEDLPPPYLPNVTKLELFQMKTVLDFKFKVFALMFSSKLVKLYLDISYGVLPDYVLQYLNDENSLRVLNCNIIDLNLNLVNLITKKTKLLSWSCTCIDLYSLTDKITFQVPENWHSLNLSFKGVDIDGLLFKYISLESIKSAENITRLVITIKYDTILEDTHVTSLLENLPNLRILKLKQTKNRWDRKVLFDKIITHNPRLYCFYLTMNKYNSCVEYDYLMTNHPNLYYFKVKFEQYYSETIPDAQDQKDFKSNRFIRLYRYNVFYYQRSSFNQNNEIISEQTETNNYIKKFNKKNKKKQCIMQ